MTYLLIIVYIAVTTLAVAFGVERNASLLSIAITQITKRNLLKRALLIFSILVTILAGAALWPIVVLARLVIWYIRLPAS